MTTWFAQLGRRLRRWVRRYRVTGFKIPYVPLQWGLKPEIKDKLDAPPDRPVLTPSECAQLLRVDEQTIIDMLESGSLRGLSVNGEWRITSVQVVEFLKQQSLATEHEILLRQISDPRKWATSLRAQPDLMKEIQSGVYSEDSFGKFLQNALRTLEDSDVQRSEN